METQLASRWKRLGGAVIDSVITAPFMLIPMAMLGVFTAGEPMSFGQRIAFFIISWIVFLGLHGYLLLNRGQTIGKAILRTKIVDESGELMNAARLIGFRYLIPGIVYMIPLVGGLASLINALFIFRKDKRCIHDHLAGTYVIDAE